MIMYIEFSKMSPSPWFHRKCTPAMHTIKPNILPFVWRRRKIHSKTTVSEARLCVKHYKIADVLFDKRARLFADIVLSNIVAMFMHIWTELWDVKLVKERVAIIVFRGTYKFDNSYFNCCIEPYQVNISPFSCFRLHTSGMHHSVPTNVDLGTLFIKFLIIYKIEAVAQWVWAFAQQAKIWVFESQPRQTYVVK